MRKNWIVLFVSKDGHEYEYRCYTTNYDDAIKRGEEYIIKLGWEHHDYKLKKVTEYKSKLYKS